MWRHAISGARSTRGEGQAVVFSPSSSDTIHTNTIEGSFSIFKRGMKGIYQHCQKKHLHRYLAEFDFRYTHREATDFNDADRSVVAMKGIVGKRLTYARPDGLNG